MMPPRAPQTAVANGATVLKTVTTDASLDEVFSHLHEDGAVIVKSILTKEQAAQCETEIAPVLAAVQAGSISDIAGIRAFHGDRTKRAGNLTNTSTVFREHVLDNDFIHAISKRAFEESDGAGDYWLGTAATIHIGPGEVRQVLHRDMGNYPVYYKLSPEGPECQLNFLIATTDFVEENGATRIIPGSNKWQYDQRGLPEMTVPAEMKAGDCLLISGKVVHGGGENKTDAWRGCISMTVCASYLTPEEAHPFIVSMETARNLSKRAQKFLGFRSQWPTKVPGLWTKDYSELALHLRLDN